MLCFDSLPQLSALLFCCCCFLFPSVSLSVSVFGVLNFLFRIGKKLCVMTMATCHSRYLETSINFCLPSKISVRDRGFTRNAATLRFRGPSPHCGVSLNGAQIKGTSVVRATSEGSGSSCCGGGGGSSGGSCSGSNKPNVAGVGAEFANMVAQSTMLEFEKEYEYGEMEGKITRDVVQDVVNEVPELLAESREEKFVDVEQILAEARSLAKGDDLIFDAELEELMV